MSYVPQDSNLIFAGHSLGKMIAQQASSNSELKENYNILNVVTFFSPLINPLGREGNVRRLGDTSDIVPYLSVCGTHLLPWQIFGLNREDGGFGVDFYSTHIKSYSIPTTWKDYDVLGIKYGTAIFTFDIKHRSKKQMTVHYIQVICFLFYINPSLLNTVRIPIVI